MPKLVRVRFAPSPTGYLHIGGARTALFNFLFARHHEGQFLLRIEDTDVSRSKEEAVQQIFNSLRWLGLEWDEEPVYQSDRIHRYQKICQDMLAKGKAYYCFCTQEQLDKKREIARKEKRDYQYDRTCLQLLDAVIHEKLSKGVPRTVRFLVPEGQTTFQDMIHGKITVQHSQIDDFILLRSDGQPVYHLAVVVDDHDMKITHVIRGDDHLSNTPKQILLYQAMGWPLPSFVHVPLILGPDQKRFSKRHGAISVEIYKDKGYLPDALINFIALLGWAPKKNEEILSIADLIVRFSIKGIHKKSAVFDEQKLLWMNGVYMRSKHPEDLYDAVVDVLRSHALIDAFKDRQNILKYIHLMKDRVKTLQEFASKGDYFFKDPVAYDEKGIKTYWNAKNVKDLFSQLKTRIANIHPWNEQSIEKCIRELAEKQNMQAGEIMHPTRLALTGVSASPGLFELIVFLGKETAILRLEKAMKYLDLKSGLQDEVGQLK
ncbi:glutamate--tRNA ligase [bacterium]|nr:glutamate--tRNA ligase [bacterium]